MVYAELGRVPLRANILFNIRYWYRILKTNNCILKVCYSYLYECVEIYNEHNWAYHVKQELFMLGCGELWINQHIYDKDGLRGLSRLEWPTAIGCVSLQAAEIRSIL